MNVKLSEIASLSPEHLANLLQYTCDVACDAGILLRGLQQTGGFTVESKHDDSPVTSADYAASDLIVQRLTELTPHLPVLTEEALKPWHERRHWGAYWLVDPLDGTQEFIYGSDDFAVSIALIEQNKPILGVIYWPAKNAVYFAGRGQGAWRKVGSVLKNISVRRLQNPATDAITIALSRRQPAERIMSRMQYGERRVERILTGSCALKSCLVAEGTADCFLRVGETGEWDTAAAQILVQEAGGSLVDEGFRPLLYNHTAQPVNPNFLVLGDPRIRWPLIFPQGLER